MFSLKYVKALIFYHFVVLSCMIPFVGLDIREMTVRNRKWNQSLWRKLLRSKINWRNRTPSKPISLVHSNGVYFRKQSNIDPSPQTLPPSPTKLACLLHGFLQVVWSRAFSLTRPALRKFISFSLFWDTSMGVVTSCANPL